MDATTNGPLDAEQGEEIEKCSNCQTALDEDGDCPNADCADSPFFRGEDDDEDVDADNPDEVEDGPVNESEGPE